MRDDRAPTGADGTVVPTVGAVDAGDRRDLVELLTRELSGRTPAEVAGDQRIGAAFLRQTVDRAVVAILAAGWRPPVSTLTTVDELDAVPDGAVLTDRHGQIWIRTEEQWCEPRSTEIEVDELIEWAPLTVHVVVPDWSTSEEAR